MSTPYLILTDDYGSAYNMPDTIWIKDRKVKNNTNVQNLMYAIGGKQTADGFPISNTLAIEGMIYDTTNSGSIETAIRTFALACERGGKLSINGDSVSRCIDVRYPEISYDWTHWPTYIKVTVTFICENPLWEDISYTSVSNIFSGNGSYTVTITGSDYIINPIITIAADQGVDVPAVLLKNLNDGGVPCNFNCPGFLAGAICVINCIDGTVRLNNVDSISFFNPAIFPRLQPGTNQLLYEGNAMTLTVQYKRLYVI